MSEIEKIARTVASLAAPGMKPKALLTEVRRKHPDATKKDLSRAAFMAAILAADSDPDRASRAHDAALASRVPDDTSSGSEPRARMPRRWKGPEKQYPSLPSS
jgi:hypothetical protein